MPGTSRNGTNSRQDKDERCTRSLADASSEKEPSEMYSDLPSLQQSPEESAQQNNEDNPMPGTSRNGTNSRQDRDANLTGLLEKLQSPFYDSYGNKLPTDPAEGEDKVIPHMLDEWKCDICRLKCANRVGLINHRKSHWKGKGLMFNNRAQAARQNAAQNNTEPSASTSRDSSHPPQALTEQAHPPSAHSPLPADIPNTDAFAPMEDEGKAAKSRKLKDIPTEELLDVLLKKEKLRRCVCGAIFKDFVLFYLHKSSHHDEEPLKCSICNEKMPDWYAFHTHFFQHKRKVDS